MFNDFATKIVPYALAKSINWRSILIFFCILCFKQNRLSIHERPTQKPLWSSASQFLYFCSTRSWSLFYINGLKFSYLSPPSFLKIEDMKPISYSFSTLPPFIRLLKGSLIILSGLSVPFLTNSAGIHQDSSSYFSCTFN